MATPGKKSGTRVTDAAPTAAPAGPPGTDGTDGDQDVATKKSPWQTATVVGIREETKRAKTFRFALPAPAERLAGQHYVIRLMAPDGYTAQRSYSVANPPDGSNEIDLTIERLEDGEVSMFMHDDVAVGDELEVRGPIGRWFVWEGTTPAVLVGGGSGVVPLMAMLRLARKLGRPELLRLLVSVRAPGDLYYSDELPGPESAVVFTRSAPPGTQRPVGHLAAADLAPLVRPGVTAYVCGSSGFADAASYLLVDLGVPAAQVRVERFGPSG
jgi:ferredoxin-NADP reductase